MISQELTDAYKTLNVAPGASDEDIAKAFKKLALKYHPDRNQNKIEWANEIMSRVNSAYSLIMSRRFEGVEAEGPFESKPKQEAKPKKKSDYFAQKIVREQMINAFVRVREETKESLYQYFQYKLYNIARRDMSMNKSMFKQVVNQIKSAYHKVQAMEKSTKDAELITHFKVFNALVFSFYKASECLNILDSYKDILDVQAYKAFHQGDQYLHRAEKELFYDRHNRGRFFQSECLENAMNAKLFFLQTLKSFPESSWAVETKIKADYVEALLAYIDLFFDN